MQAITLSFGFLATIYLARQIFSLHKQEASAVATLDNSAEATAKKMGTLILSGYFRKHILTNDALPYDDDAALEDYNDFLKKNININAIKALHGISL